MDLKFSCPQCGSQTFKTDAEPKSLEDFDGAVCADCGAVVTEEDVKAQLQAVAEGMMRKALRDAGMK
jgi:transcription initiation factor TFIIIB Brf1 subunit/transcription initiation factor TFIIB